MRIPENNVLIDENKSVDRLSAGVFVIPDVGTIPMAFGRVIKLGEGMNNPELENDKIPFFVNEGDFVIYNPGVAVPIEVTSKTLGANSKKKYLKLSAGECMLVLEEEDGKTVGIKRMLENYLLLKMESTTEKKASNKIYCPEYNADSSIVTGKVIMVGPGRYNFKLRKQVPCNAQVGDTVAFASVKKIELSIPVKQADGKTVKEKFYMIPDTAVEAILEDDETLN
jgi:co-chaperonin GroES (HSP10)